MGRMHRRGFLRAAGNILAGAAISGMMLGNAACHTPQRTNVPIVRQDSHFDNLWNLMKEYADVKNQYLMGNAPDSSKRSAWIRVKEYQRTYFPEANFTDTDEIRHFFENFGKFYNNSSSMTNPFQKANVLGDIVEYDLSNAGLEDRFDETTGRFHFEWNGRNPDNTPRSLDYRIIAFRQEGETVDNLRGNAGWAALHIDEDSTIYLNLTGIENSAAMIHDYGKWIDQDRLDKDINNLDSFPESRQKRVFYDFMSKEFHDQIMSETIKRNPFLEISRRYDSQSSRTRLRKAWIDTARDVIIKSLVDHEKLHHWFGYQDNEGSEVRQEKETFYFEGQNRFNSYVFLQTNSNYAPFYESLEQAGYSRKKLMKMSPSQRENMFKEMLPNSE